MNLIFTKDYENMSRVAAMELMGWIAQGKNKRMNLAITAGSTPVRMYEIIQDFLKENTFEKIRYYNFDEIHVKNAPSLTIESLYRLFYRPCHIDESRIEVFDEHNYQTYDEKIAQEGGIDMIMIGLGLDAVFAEIYQVQ